MKTKQRTRFDRETARRTLEALTQPGQWFEVYAFEHKSGQYFNTLSGFFDNVDDALREAERVSGRCKGVYLSFNTLHDGVKDKKTPNKLTRALKDQRASDQEVTRRRAFFVDIDPACAVKGVSATDDERDGALSLAEDVIEHLSKQGWPKPIVGHSGNGAQMLWAVDIEANKETDRVFRQALEALIAQFSGLDWASIDESIYNRSRGCRFFGTLNCKGQDSPERPHRIATLESLPERELVTLDQLKKLASKAPSAKQAQAKKFRGTDDGFSWQDCSSHEVKDRLTQLGLEFREKSQGAGTLFELKHCPHNPEHDKWRCFVRVENGSLSAKCHHAKCSIQSWPDLKAIIDPAASQRKADYSRKRRTKSDRHGARTYGNVDRQNVEIVDEPEPVIEPMPFGDDEPEEYPIDSLGPVLANMARAMFERTTAPLALCCQSVLSTAGLVTQKMANAIWVTREQDPRSKGIAIGMFLLTIAKSGEGKSSADRLALAPYETWRKSRRARDANEQNYYQMRKESWEARLQAIKKSDEPDHKKKKDIDELGPEPSRPLKSRLVIKNATVEGIYRDFEETNPSMGLINAEGGIFFGGPGYTAENRRKFISTACSTHSDEAYNKSLKGSGSKEHYGRRFSIHLQVQPGLADQVLSDDILEDSGFFARTFIARPASRIGQCFREKGYKPSAESEEWMRDYERAMLVALNCEASHAPGDKFELTPRVLFCDEEGAELLRQFFNETESELKPGGKYQDFVSLGRRACEHATRAAAVTALFHNPDIDLLTAEDVQRGIDLTRYYLDEAMRVRGLALESQAQKAAKLIEQWLNAEGLEFFDRTLIRLYGPSSTREKEIMEDAIALLKEHGRVAKAEKGTAIKFRDKPERKAQKPLRLITFKRGAA